MNTPIEILLAVADIGGQLGIADGNTLRMRLPADCPQVLKGAIREKKPALLQLLRLNFLLIQSDALGATLYWTPDEGTKEALAAAGADPGSIYMAPELAQLVRRRVTTGELPLIHAAKLRFQGRLTEPH